jgi:hypothetical protein
MITMGLRFHQKQPGRGESALTVQLDIDTLEIEGETDVTMMTSMRIALRKESEVIHAHHPPLLDQDNFEA